MSDRRIPFTQEDEDRIASTALWGSIAAIASLVATSVNTVLTMMAQPSLRDIIVRVVSFVITVMLSIWLLQACGAFRKVARTDIADKAYLLYGFRRLHKYFMTIGILMSIAIVLVILFVLLVLVLKVTSFGMPRF